MTDMRRITWIALGALAVGLLAGAALAGAGVSWIEQLVGVLQPIGTLWINAVRMTIVPLVVSMLIAAVASAESARSMGRLGGALFAYFIVMMVIIGVYTALLAPPLLAGLLIDPASAEALRATAASRSQEVSAAVGGLGGIGDRVAELIPYNPMRAAADTNMVQLVVFALILGAALSQVATELRDTAIRFFRSISEAMLVVVRWVFIAAPIGVFALAVVVGARLGYAAVAAVGYYVVVFVALMFGIMLMFYVTAVVIGRVPLRLFATAVAPAQVIAIGSRSSSAALPAMIEAARDILKMPPRIISFVLPTAVAIFRVSTPVSFVMGALFLGKLYDVPLDTGQIVALVALSIPLTFSVPPVPSGSIFLMAPVFAGMGIPVEGVAILIAIDVIPDIMKTTAIVTAHMSSAAVANRVMGGAEVQP
jgi:Na+/H+-dicarboxylate symporter